VRVPTPPPFVYTRAMALWTGVALSLPLLAFVLLMRSPSLDLTWEHHPSHFWLVLTTAATSAVLAYATGSAAERRGDARVLLVSLAFLSAAGFLGLHALATPGVLLAAPNAGFVIATPVGIALGSLLAVPSSLDLSGERAVHGVRWARRGRRALVALMVLWAVVSLAQLPPLHAEQAVPEQADGILAGLAVPAVLGVVQDEVERWSPDVVVHEAAELAAPLAAARAGIPSVSHGFGEVIPAMAMRGAGEVLAPAWRDAGLEPDPWAGSYRGMHVDIYPPSLRSEPMDHVADVQACRPAEGVPADGHRVYVSFGTLFNQPGELFRTAALAAAEVAEEVLVTVGPGVDPAALGPLPAHVQVEAFVPQAEVLPSCAAVVCHAGSGTVLAALAHGVPLVCLPQAADQFANAHNVARRGAGEVRTGPDLDHADVRDAVERVLRSPGPRAAAAEVAAEISTMPGTDEVASAIEARVRAA